MFNRKFGDPPLHLFGVHGAGGIARRIGDQNFGTWRDPGGYLIRIRLQAIPLGQYNRDRNAAEAECDRWISGKTRLGIKHFITRLDQCHHRQKQRDLAAGRDHNIAWRNVEIAGLAQIDSQLLAQSGQASNRAVAVFPFPDGFLEGVNDRFGGVEIRLTQFQVNDGATLPFQFLRVRKDGERSFAAHHRHSGSQRPHLVLLFEKTFRHGSGGDAQGIDKTRKEIEGRSRRGQFDDLPVIIEALQLGIEIVADLVWRAVKLVGAAEANFFCLAEWTFFKLALNGLDLSIASSFLFRRNRMGSGSIIAVL